MRSAAIAERDRLIAENERLRLRVLSAAGDDLCRLTQEEIKDLSAGKVQIPPEGEFLASCKNFHSQIASKSGVLPGCLTLAQMIAENERLRSAVVWDSTPGLPPVPVTQERYDAVCQERARLADEVERLTANYPGGDQGAQARSWSAVWKALESAGMLSYLCPSMLGRDRAVGFIGHLAAERERLRAERDALKQELDQLTAFVDGIRDAAKNRNPEGATILDFLVCWNEQYETRLAASEQRRRELVEALRPLAEARIEPLVDIPGEDICGLDKADVYLARAELSKEGNNESENQAKAQTNLSLPQV